MRSKRSTSDLLAQLETAKDEKVKPNLKNQVAEFLRKYDLEPGDKAVSAKLLYKLYIKTTVKPKTKSYFTRHLRTLFSYTGSGMIYVNVDMYEVLHKIDSLDKTKKHVVNRRKNVRKEYEGFLKNYEIKEGTIVLEGFVLYYLYDNWIYKKRRDGISEWTFYDVSRLYFDHEFKNEEICFKIDEGAFKHLSEAVLKEVRNGRKWRNEKFKKTKPKK